MKYFYYRGEKCKECNNAVPIFALGHHKPLEEGEEQFSKVCMGFYKHGYSLQYFLKRLVQLYKERNDIQFDMICLCPSSKKDSFNENMKKLTEEFYKTVQLPYKQVLHRTKDTDKQHELKKKEERIENVKDSFSVSEDITGKNILVIDNLSTSGSTAQEIHRLIVHKHNAKSCVFVCLSLGYKAKDLDFDLNPAFSGKFSYIIEKLHWPKVPKSKRIKIEDLPESEE
ncbi:MAG: hypothetical protein ABII39_04205 [Candidatus Micrarchaeota archaeon]